MSHQGPQFQQEEEINLREEFEKYIRYWPWFVLSVLLCVVIAFLYLRYTTPVYQTTASIIVKDEKNGGAMSELAAFEGMGIFNGMGTNSLENELGILRSKRLMTDVVKNLQLNVQYFIEGNVMTSEVYAEKPIDVQILQLEETALPTSRRFKISEAGNEEIRITDVETSKELKARYGNPVDL